MTRVNIFSFILVIALIGFSCKKGESNPTSNNDNINTTSSLWPLKVGNMWIEQSTSYDTSGNIDRIEVDTTSIQKDTIIGNETWFGEGDTHFYSNRTDGVYMKILGVPPSYPSYNYTGLYIKYPITIGSTFIDSFGGYTVTLTSSSQQITVPNGVHSCYVYHGTNSANGYKFDEYWKPGIGRVKREKYIITQSGRSYLVNKKELQNYSLR